MTLILQGDTYSGSHNVGSLAISIAFWAKGDEGMGGQTLLQLGDGAAYIKLYIDEGTEYVSAEVYDGVSTKYWVGTDVLRIDRWRHIALVAQYSGRALYIDGVKTTDAGNLSCNPTLDLWVACDADEKGIAATLEISDLAIWAGVLSDDMVTSLYQGASPYQISPISLTHYWPFLCVGANGSHVASYTDEVGGDVLTSGGAISAASDLQPPVAYMYHRQMLPPPGRVAPWQRLAPWYAVSVRLTDSDISEYVDFKTITVKDTGGVELETAAFTMRTPLTAEPYEWREVEIWSDYGTSLATCIFAGHVTRDVRTFSASGVEVIHDLKAEGWKTLLSRSKPFADSWKAQSLTTIIEDMLTSGERTGFTVQAVDATIDYWTIDMAETVSKNIERLCSENDWRWRVTWDKVVIVGPEGDDVAPFGIAQGSEADYFMLYPVENVALELDGSEITNAVILQGGTATDSASETFVGDGVTEDFTLAVHPIASITQITVDGAVKSWGTLGYHNCGERDVLVHFAGGYIRCCTPPANGKNVVVDYTYQFAYTYQTDSEPSQSYYGPVLWELVEAPWISDDTQAATYIASLFAMRAYSPKRLTAELRRAGLRAGQTCPVSFSSLGLSAGTYLHIESIGITVDENRRLRFDLRLGPADEKLSTAIAQTTN